MQGGGQRAGLGPAQCVLNVAGVTGDGRGACPCASERWLLWGDGAEPSKAVVVGFVAKGGRIVKPG